MESQPLGLYSTEVMQIMSLFTFLLIYFLSPLDWREVSVELTEDDTGIIPLWLFYVQCSWPALFRWHTDG
jgi:hypothetical protein